MTEQDVPMLRDRARGCLLGLAIGDAMGAPAENMTAAEIRERWGTIDGFLTADPAGTDDTEFAAFSALLLVEHGLGLTPGHVADAWHTHLVGRDAFPGGGFSTLAAVENLRRGVEPPASGQHLHSWSDSLAMRAAVFGVFAPGSPDVAARLAAADGSVELAEEGIYGGQAVAAAVAVAMTGADAASCAQAALAVVPAASWTSRTLRAAVSVCAAAPPPVDPPPVDLGEVRTPLSKEFGLPQALLQDQRGNGWGEALVEAIVPRRYPWTDLAPEAVGLAFGAFLAADGDVRRSITGAISMGRDADTTAAIAGALAGASRGGSAVPAEWRTAIRPVTGRCLGDVVGGLEPVGLADRLVEARA